MANDSGGLRQRKRYRTRCRLLQWSEFQHLSLQPRGHYCQFQLGEIQHPIAGRVNADNFSVRWAGKSDATLSDNYTFYVNSDNGRKLWINNQLIIDKWIDDYGVEYSGTISLTANQLYDIKLEYFESYGGANCKLEWFSLRRGAR